MAWIYLAESEDSPWPWRPGSDRSPTVSETDTAKLRFCRGCGTVQFHALQFGTTSPRSYLSCCPDRELTSSMAASPARTSLCAGLAKAWRASALDFSLRLRGSFARFDRPSSSWKTLQPSLFEGSIRSPPTWPRSGMTVAGTCYELAMWERPTKENAGGFWPTPTARDYKSPGVSAQRARRDKYRTALPLSVVFKERYGYRLPPSFVEYLMGYAPQHTVSAAWAMQWFRNAPAKRSAD